jgi:3-(3-hydroxy-phenyl)propionate hydroxylase
MQYDGPAFDYIPPPGLTAPEPRHSIAIIGAGPIGLAMAVDLATRGVPSVVLDDNNVVSVGSRAICWAKRTLEVFDRLGIGERMLAKGVTWQVGRVFHGADQVYAFDLQPETGHKYPAFINLQQYYVEQYLVERARDFPDLIDLRFLNKVTDHQDLEDHIKITIETPDGEYEIEADFLLACDGTPSATRHRMGLDFTGQDFDENFLIVDIDMPESPFKSNTAERWFWFEPTFHSGQSALLHKQPDNIYRIDLQLGPDADIQAELDEDRLVARIRAVVGDAPFTIDWKSIYRFRCARLKRFVHNRVIFVGDSAHVVSPFGARGGNGGIQDVDNLGWKLATVLAGGNPALIESYNIERVQAADENILNSARTTNFMTPKSATEALFRNEVLRLARTLPFARRLINAGRLSVPCVLDSPLSTPGAAPVSPGTAIPDAPHGAGWLIERLQGQFTLASFGRAVATRHPTVPSVHITDAVAVERYGDGLTYLIRPDGHVAAVFTRPHQAEVSAAVARAIGEH